MREILQAFEKPENKAKIREIEQDAGNDLVKLLQDRLPFAAEIQQEVIKSHGFSDDGDQGNVHNLIFSNSCVIWNKLILQMVLTGQYELIVNSSWDWLST